MAFVTLIPEQTWQTGQSGALGNVNVPSNLDSVELRIVPNLSDWTSDQAAPPENRRLVRLAIEQSLDGGSVWQPWAGALFRTGALPRSGILSLVVTVGPGRGRKARGRVTITGAPVIFGIEGEVRREAA
jgi:hypothetical protein